MIDANASAVVPDFRKAMRRLAATVTLVSTADESGQRHGMAATAISSVTMDPPTLLICINHTASIHEPLLRRRSFCVNVLMTLHHDLVGAFSGQKSGEARFDSGDWLRDESTGLPYLAGAQSNLFCRVESVTSVGTHSVILAGVSAVRVADEVSPLLYADGRLLAIGEPAAR